MKISIALIGDHDESVTAHQAIPLAIGLTADALKIDATIEWVSTESVSAQKLSQFHAIWCVPASPYKNIDGALTAIQFARRNDIPFLGTCGGYQHAILEFAQHVLGFEKAECVEQNPDTEMPLISALSCKLIEQTGSINLEADSQVSAFYQSDKIDEDYHCSFGVNPDYLFIFDGSDLCFTGHDELSAPKILELPDHRFFIGTAFQPERSALKQQVHPLIFGFLQAAVETKIVAA
jgi:CTP synthase (UTP-ammonia lyase)